MNTHFDDKQLDTLYNLLITSLKNKEYLTNFYSAIESKNTNFEIKQRLNSQIDTIKHSNSVVFDETKENFIKLLSGAIHIKNDMDVWCNMLSSHQTKAYHNSAYKKPPNYDKKVYKFILDAVNDKEHLQNNQQHLNLWLYYNMVKNNAIEPDKNVILNLLKNANADWYDNDINSVLNLFSLCKTEDGLDDLHRLYKTVKSNYTKISIYNLINNISPTSLNNNFYDKEESITYSFKFKISTMTLLNYLNIDLNTISQDEQQNLAKNMEDINYIVSRTILQKIKNIRFYTSDSHSVFESTDMNLINKVKEHLSIFELNIPVLSNIMIYEKDVFNKSIEILLEKGLLEFKLVEHGSIKNNHKTKL